MKENMNRPITTEDLRQAFNEIASRNWRFGMIGGLLNGIWIGMLIGKLLL
jgi:hypothetical protein